MVRTLFRVSGLIVALLMVTPTIDAQTGTIKMDSTRQVIRGFGGIHINAWQGTTLPTGLQEKAFNNDPGDLGLSILRLQIAPDSNAFGNELPIARYAVNKGAIVFASPWDPPSYMLDPASAQNRILEAYYDDYVDHLNQFNSFMNDSGVPIYAISVQNEPDYGDWTRWTPNEMVTFLKDHGQNIQSRVMAPESFQFRKPFSDTILNNPESEANVDIIGAHIYGDGLEDYPLAREKGKDVWMTEHYTSSDRSANLWPDALLVGQEIADCMQANYNAYIWWYIRRFYGLITDDGLVTKRGYVLSQFSKFVRPNAKRIDVQLSAANGVDATAFRTDTSLVLVVVNNNSTSVELSFTIEDNIGIDSLTQFTTSSTKNVENLGGITISGNSFTASFEASSISTLTSYAANGGNAYNLFPIAHAGEDIEQVDADSNGYETITLDGTLSSDTDGNIIDYTWILDDEYLTSGEEVVVDLPLGPHTVILSVTDDGGAINTDTIDVNVVSIFNTELYAEAECLSVGATWDTLYDTDASNGACLATPTGTESTEAASTNPDDWVVYEFTIEESGPYKVWARVNTPSATDDSFWVRMDDGTWYMWNSIPSSDAWQWDDVHDGGPENTVIWDLEAGSHTLSICYREDGAKLDKILIINTGLTPTEFGEEGVTCDIEIPEPEPEPENAIDLIESTEANIFPNPATNQLQISWEQGFTEVQILSADGQLVKHERFYTLIRNATIDLEVSSGLYIVVLHNGKDKTMNRLLVQ